ncbi:MAG: YfhO family protein, partial [Erysipelotrichaceae bacterium]|nr:YfhO family protein [Erysipelotrichaceae bacterium]
MSTNKKHLIPIFVIIVTLYLYSIIINDGVLIFYGDSYEQVLQFYAGMWTKFHNGNIGFWDWYLGFGANSFTTMYYCNLNNIYFYVSLLFPKSFLPQLLTIYPLLKLLLTYITSFYWLRKINRSFYSSIIGSLIITFSGWVMALFNYNIFLDTYPMYFLTLYLFEDYLLNKKPFFTVLSISLIIITNFYNGYMFLPFFLAYSVYRYYLVVENPLLIDTIKFSLKIMLLILVAVAISGVVLIPSIYIVLQTPRLDENSIFHFINLSTLFRFLSSMYIPVSYKLNPNLFINLNQYNGIGWSGGTSLFSLVIGVTIIPLLPYISSKKNRKALICLFVLFFIILCVPTLYKLLQGTEETRWFFMFSILVSLAITSIIEDIITGSITNKILVRSYLLSVLIFFSILFISLTKGWYFDKSDLALFTLSFLVLSSLYTFFLSKKAKTTIIVIIVVEVLFNMINLLRFDPPKNSNDININQLSEVVEYIQNKDSSYYRIYFSESSRQVANSPYAYNYMASSFYSSLYNFEQLDYLRRYTGSWIANQADGRIYNYNIEGYKYWIGYEYETAPYGYKFIDKFYDYMIYENQYYQGLGFMSNE